MKRAEILGSATSDNPLENFLLNKIEEVGLVDLEPIKLVPTWRNMRMGLARVEQILDVILVSKFIINDHDGIRWRLMGNQIIF
jgi:hypothetical protein